MKKAPIQMVFADERGKVYPVPFLHAAGMKAGSYYPLSRQDLVKVPPSSEFFVLPDRDPAGFDPLTGQQVFLERDPYRSVLRSCRPVSVFLTPGFTLTHQAAYRERPNAKRLPLFAYGACAYIEGDFYAAAVRVDRGTRHDQSQIQMGEVCRRAAAIEKRFSKNRLVRHLRACATINHCPNAKNFFLGRFEAPLPVSPACNARCLGCISLQEKTGVPPTQTRLLFVPTPLELAEVACYHLEHCARPIVSFGQGCEGEPTLYSKVIEEAIRLIRQRTKRGLIHMNTNGGRPRDLERLFKAGLGSIRVSTNSFRKKYYDLYYKPKDYSFGDIRSTIRMAKKRQIFVSVNYLVMPGFTDQPKEAGAFERFVAACRPDMVQWRNLNYDPLAYFRDLGLSHGQSELIGMRELIRYVKKRFPRLRQGYFNPYLRIKQ